MKKLTAVALLLAVTLTFATSCASTQPIGILMTDVRLPLVTGDAAKATKVGIAESKSLLNLVATGDSSMWTGKPTPCSASCRPIAALSTANSLTC